MTEKQKFVRLITIVIVLVLPPVLFFRVWIRDERRWLLGSLAVVLAEPGP